VYSSYYEQILPSADFVQLSASDIENERFEFDRQLDDLTAKLKGKCKGSVEVEIAISELSVLRSMVAWKKLHPQKICIQTISRLFHKLQQI
jgi:hypothetical protein